MKTLQLTIFLSIGLFNQIASAQTPNWQWAKRAGGISSEDIVSMVADIYGNTYVTGVFNSPSISFDTFTIINNLYVGGLNNPDIYTVKYDATGKVIWAKGVGGRSQPYSLGITIDQNENAYVVGAFHDSTIIFDGVILNNSGFENVFIVKYNRSGNVIWAKSSYLPAQQDARALFASADIYGNVYIAGYVSSDSLSFGALTLPDLVNQLGNTFIVKYDTMGTPLWLKSIKGVQVNLAGITNDQNGNLYLCGSFNSQSLVLGMDTLINTGSYDCFVAKYNSVGSEIWAKSAGGADYDAASAICTDKSSNIYLAGTYSSPSIMWGNVVLNNVSRSGLSDFFVCKYDTSGQLLWAKSGGGSGGDEISSVCSDSKADIFVTGTTGSDTLIFGADTLIANGTANGNILTAEFDSVGRNVWADFIQGSQTDFGCSISADTHDNIYIAGYFQSPSITIGTSTLVNAGVDDIFLAQLQTDGKTTGTDNIGRASKINVYPNPSNSTFYFNGVTTGNIIEVYDIMGQQVSEVSASRNNFPVNLSSKSKGIYFYKVIDPNNTIQQGKIVVE